MIGCGFNHSYFPKNWSTVRDIPERYIKEVGKVRLTIKDAFEFGNGCKCNVENIVFRAVPKDNDIQVLSVENGSQVTFTNCGFSAAAYHSMFVEKSQVSLHGKKMPFSLVLAKIAFCRM